MRVVLFCLLGMTSVALGAAHPGAAPKPDPATILQQVCQAHNGLRTYRAKVTLLAQVTVKGKPFLFTNHTTLALDRGDKPRGALRSVHGLSVCDGKRFLRYQAHANAYTIESAPDTLPGYLFRLPYGLQVTQGPLTSLLLMHDLSLRLDPKRMGGVQIVEDKPRSPDLVHVQAKTAMYVTDMWIDRESYLIRRYRQTTYAGHRPSSRGVTILWGEESHTDVQANQPIPDDAFSIKIPPGAEKVYRLPRLPHMAELIEAQMKRKKQAKDKSVPSTDQSSPKRRSRSN